MRSCPLGRGLRGEESTKAQATAVHLNVIVSDKWGKNALSAPLGGRRPGLLEYNSLLNLDQKTCSNL